MSRKKFYKITVEKLDALFLAGEQMSNICFNLAQRESQPASDRRSMKESQIAWDKARNELAGETR